MNFRVPPKDKHLKIFKQNQTSSYKTGGIFSGVFCLSLLLSQEAFHWEHKRAFTELKCSKGTFV